MKRAFIFSLILGCLSLPVVTASAQKQPGEPKPTDVEINAHVYEPVQLKVSDDLIKQLKLPDGFKIQKFAEGLGKPRIMTVAPDGTVYVTRRDPGDVIMLRDTNGDGTADIKQIVAKKPKLHGIALRGNTMYLTTIREIYTADRLPDGRLGRLRQIISDLPDAGQHPNRTIAFGPDGMLYITVGSTCNACTENDTNATILRASPDGRNRQIFASGLRNTIGFGWHPVTRQMYGMDHGIDWLGDNEQKEELNRIEAGKRYGWPYIYADGKYNPQDEPPNGITMAQWAKMSQEPVALYTAHSAPMQMAFYTANQFPAEYKNDAFVAMRGSWNRKPPSGHEIVRIRFDKSGNPTAIEPFLTGFLVKMNKEDYGRFARPVGVSVAKDGSLLIGDNMNGVIYRISYAK
ncbi:PQQ-dependent sugar dehydrogenase [Calothrix sp. CCY 0018]|uniref:PQQ-dependent sugar dehydrogenase n=1 Tax=Calothrix sp. CCY 0018 TaxID=3103864 RepID=UPI0039C6783C